VEHFCIDGFIVYIPAHDPGSDIGFYRFF